MNLILFRHGTAVSSEDPDCPDDPDRPLTSKGVRRTEAAARGIRAFELQPDVILSSPYIRAVETARIAAKVLDVGASAEQFTQALVPSAPAEAVLDLIRKQEAPVVMCVGHAPNLDAVLASCLGLGQPLTRIRKAGAACVELGGGAPVLRWLMGPRALRRLGR